MTWFNHVYERNIHFILYFVGNTGNIEKIKLSIILPLKENPFQSFFLFKYALYILTFQNEDHS